VESRTAKVHVFHYAQEFMGLTDTSDLLRPVGLTASEINLLLPVQKL
jgi:hypothetical protein